MEVARPSADAQQVLARICPYLLSEDGAWRAARPMREHRCTAVRPPAPLSAEKQKRLCLVDAHRGCPAFEAAQDRRAAELARAGISTQALAVRQGRPLARTTPVALDRPSAVSGPRVLAQGYRRLGQAAVVVLVVLAAAALALARFTPGGFLAGDGSASPEPSRLAVATTAAPSPTESPSEERPSPSPTERRSRAPSPSRSAGPETYRVRPGDNLSEIAERFRTTVDVLAELNGIENPSQLRVGQILRLPSR